MRSGLGRSYKGHVHIVVVKDIGRALPCSTGSRTAAAGLGHRSAPRRSALPSIALLAVMFGCYMHATTIVAVRTSNTIFIGSDSKIIDGEGGEAGKACKIVTFNGISIAIARLWGSPAQGFSVAAVAAEALNSNSDLASRINHFERLLTRPLEQLLTSLKTADSVRFKRELEGQSAVDVLFVGFDSNYPVLLMRSFMVRSGASQSITVRIKREECSRDCSDGLAYVVLGQHSSIDKTLADNPTFWKIGAVEAIRKLINLEILAAPSFVGPPLSILAIDKSGPRWIEQGVCQDIRSQ